MLLQAKYVSTILGTAVELFSSSVFTPKKGARSSDPRCCCCHFAVHPRQQYPWLKRPSAKRLHSQRALSSSSPQGMGHPIKSKASDKEGAGFAPPARLGRHGVPPASAHRASCGRGRSPHRKAAESGQPRVSPDYPPGRRLPKGRRARPADPGRASRSDRQRGLPDDGYRLQVHRNPSHRGRPGGPPRAGSLRRSASPARAGSGPGRGRRAPPAVGPGQPGCRHWQSRYRRAAGTGGGAPGRHQPPGRQPARPGCTGQ